jgi:elongation factor Ts
MAVDATLAYTLSKQSGLGAEICKLALERTKNDVESAIKLLKRWCGTATTASTANNPAQNFGVVCTYLKEDIAVVVEVKCSDELFSQSKPFYEMAAQVASETIEWGDHYSAREEIKELEKQHNLQITVRSMQFDRSTPLSLLTTYTHQDTIGVMVETEVATPEAFSDRQFKLFSFDLAMHIAAFRPLCVSVNDIPADMKREAQVQIEKQLAHEGKDMQFWAVASEGKMERWTKQRSLLNQIFIKSDRESVEEVRKQVSEKIGSEITIKRFARLALGS